MYRKTLSLSCFALIALVAALASAQAPAPLPPPSPGDYADLMGFELPTEERRQETPPRDRDDQGQEIATFRIHESYWDDPLPPTPVGDCWLYQVPYIWEIYDEDFVVALDPDTGQELFTAVPDSHRTILKVAFNVVFKVCPGGTTFTGYIAEVLQVGNTQGLLPDEVEKLVATAPRIPDLPMPPGGGVPPAPTFTPQTIQGAIKSTRWIDDVQHLCWAEYRPVGPPVVEGCLVTVPYQWFEVCQPIDPETNEPVPPGTATPTTPDPFYETWKIDPCG